MESVIEEGLEAISGVSKNPKTARFSEAPWFSPKLDVFVDGWTVL